MSDYMSVNVRRERKGEGTYLIYFAITMNVPFFSIHSIVLRPLQGSSKYVKDTAHDASSVSKSKNNEVKRGSDEFDRYFGWIEYDGYRSIYQQRCCFHTKFGLEGNWNDLPNGVL